MNPTIENVNVTNITKLITAGALKKEIPLSQRAEKVVAETRRIIADILNGKDERLLVLVGPCSIHNLEAALEYADKLATLQKKVPHLFLVMRTYFEKPRTTTGWTGLIADPHLNGSFEIEEGLRMARKLLLSVNEKGVPCGTEFLDPLVPTFIADLIAWGAIGARTTESQTHRQMASVLSMPIGFKNGTAGSVDIAAHAIISARAEHKVISQDDDGNTSIVEGKGNPHCHLVLRGGKTGPNFDGESIRAARATLAENGLPTAGIMVDCSHANSEKRFENQGAVLKNVVEQRASGNKTIIGVMLESNLEEGKQLITDSPLVHGVSITDACIGWSDTEKLLSEANEALS